MKRTIPRLSLVFLFGAWAWLIQSETVQGQTGPILGAQLYGGITITGTVNTLYYIQGTTNLSDANSWMTLASVFLTKSPWLFIDYDSPGMARRYYQAAVTNTNPNPDVPTGMALIPAGSFTMGNCMEPTEGFSDELPLLTVYVSTFYMDKNLVTKTLWGEVYQWAIAHGYSFNNAGSGKAANHPVQQVSWSDVVKWCNARSEKEGRVPAYYTSAGLTNVFRTGQANIQNDWVKWNSGYRLPTEAEWEKAARGGLSGKCYPWGDTITHSQANYYSDAQFAFDISPTRGWQPSYHNWLELAPYTSPVGSFAANGYGLYDMAGNVFAWCWDGYGSYGSGMQTDPRGVTPGSYRVVRGGCWSYFASLCRTAHRYSSWAGNWGSSYIGFRSVLSPSQYSGPILEARMYAGITLSGTVNTPYALQATTNLLDINSWRTLTNVFLLNSKWLFIDYDSPGMAGRYYRAVVENNGNTNQHLLNPDPTHLVWINPGTFMMGSFFNEVDRDSDEGPQFLVTISNGYFISKYETTQEEYLAVMGNNPACFTGDLKRPVENVFWSDATNYCGKLTALERAAGRLPARYAYRLPMETEWEYACRAGRTTRFSFGDDPGYTQLGDYAWYASNSGGTTHPVGLKQPNAWGLYDMNGNVYEWCLDWLGTYPDGHFTYPPGPSFLVNRGGSWNRDGRYCRSAYRGGTTPNYRHEGLGFRVVLAPGQ